MRTSSHGLIKVRMNQDMKPMEPKYRTVIQAVAILLVLSVVVLMHEKDNAAKSGDRPVAEAKAP